jgi:hypothetical protein
MTPVRSELVDATFVAPCRSVIEFRDVVLVLYVLDFDAREVPPEVAPDF